MNYDQHDDGSAPTPFDDAEGAFDLYMTSLYNEGRVQFTRYLPVEAGLTEIVGPSRPQSSDIINNKTVSSRTIVYVGQAVALVLQWITRVLVASGKVKMSFYRPDMRVSAGRLVQAAPVEDLTELLDRVNKYIDELMSAAKKRGKFSRDPEIQNRLRIARATLYALRRGLNRRQLEKDAAVNLVRTARDNMCKSRPVHVFLKFATLALFFSILLANAAVLATFMKEGYVITALLGLLSVSYASGKMYRHVKPFQGLASSQIALKRAFERLEVDVERLFNDSDDRSGTTVTS